MGEIKYCNGKTLPDRLSAVAVFSLLSVFGAVYGFVYEMIFYYINGGMKKFYWRGSCFGPWILIYAVGSYVIYFSTAKFRKNPLLVFAVGGLGCGALELAAGYIMFKINGHRGWNYNTEILNFGNIGGFICLRSVLVFAASGLFLVYAVMPFIFFLYNKMGKRLFCIVAFGALFLFLIDNIYNGIFAQNIDGLVSANKFYTDMGFGLTDFV